MLEGGDGPPLVLLHGGIECGGVYWTPVLSALAESHRLVVPDVPGLGESEPVARLDEEVFAAWISDLIRLTCDGRPAVVAHSLLGSLAVRFAARHGDLLRRLVVYGTPGVGPFRMSLGLRLMVIRFALRPTEANMERFARWAFLDFDRALQWNGAWLEAFSAYDLSRSTVPHVKRTMRRLVASCTKRVPDSELGRIDVPTSLLWGRHDRFVPLGLAQGTSARLGWPLHVIEDVGHAPHMERPDDFIEALRTLQVVEH